ncbi:MAG: RNA-guided pseudouridylation complex pseudouridine synthase subunit Cbf5 [DPANN group archaeon]|nr:RNA-guided pseudouridylation complex pseudouridine synthase subunit Cbf5 [DPANN group archaeon]
MNSLVIIDKPAGPASNQVTQWVKEIFNEKSTHCGTLDPQVSGVLPVLMGNKAIKLQPYLMTSDKEYIVLARSEKPLQETDIQGALREFTGKIYQTPPEISAVAKKTRIRQIYETELIETQGNYFLFRAVCQHGTYIRKLIEDLSHVLGTKVTMEELRRTRTGAFTEQQAYTLTKINDLHALGRDSLVTLTLEQAVQKLPRIDINTKAAENIAKGADLYNIGIMAKKGSIQKGTPVALFHDQQLIAVGDALCDETQFSKQKGAVIKTKKVLQEKVNE